MVRMRTLVESDPTRSLRKQVDAYKHAPWKSVCAEVRSRIYDAVFLKKIYINAFCHGVVPQILNERYSARTVRA